MLNSSIEDVLVNACNAIDLLCRNNEYMQNELAKYGIIKQLTDLLSLDSSEPDRIRKKKSFLHTLPSSRSVTGNRVFSIGINYI